MKLTRSPLVRASHAITRLASLVSALLVLGTVRDADAQPQPGQDPRSPQAQVHEPGSRQHDGFMLRIGFGIGGGASHIDSSHERDPIDLTLSGASIGFTFDIGGAIAENLLLHARIAGLGLPSGRPTNDDGDDLARGERVIQGSTLLAPAVTYYFMPLNLYLTAAVGLAWIDGYEGERLDEVEANDTAAGPGLAFDVGKEWWVAEQWGLGLAGRFSYSRASGSVKDRELVREYDADFIGGTLLLSATYQ